MKLLKKLMLPAVVAAALSSGAVLASGSEGFSQAPNNDARLYNVGKGVFADKFSCSSCPLAGKSANAEIARDIVSGKTKATLTSDEQTAVNAYLKRRFKL